MSDHTSTHTDSFSQSVHETDTNHSSQSVSSERPTTHDTRIDTSHEYQTSPSHISSAEISNRQETIGQQQSGNERPVTNGTGDNSRPGHPPANITIKPDADKDGASVTARAAGNEGSIHPYAEGRAGINSDGRPSASGGMGVEARGTVGGMPVTGRLGGEANTQNEQRVTGSITVGREDNWQFTMSGHTGSQGTGGEVTLQVGSTETKPPQSNDNSAVRALHAVDQAINPNPYFNPDGSLTPLGMQRTARELDPYLPQSLRSKPEEPLLPPVERPHHSEEPENRTHGH